MQERLNELGNESIARLLIKYSTPAMIAMFVNSMYNLVDTIFVGYGAGTLALAALAVSWPVQMIVVAIGMAVGIGTASVISRSLGAGDHDRAERVAGTSFVVIGVIALAITCLGLLFLQPLLRLFGATEAIMPYAVDYLSIIFIGNFFLASSISANNIIRSEGAARVAMISMITGAVVNTILDPIFIFGLDMGIRGAAIATVIANISTFTFISWFFFSGRSILNIKRRHLIPDLNELPEVAKIGSATFFSMIVGSLMAIPINGLIIHYGEDIHLAIIGVTNRAMMFFFMPIFGLTQGLQPIIGFNYGAKKLERVKETVRKASMYATIMSVFAFLVLMFATQPLLRIFSPDKELIIEGIPIVRILCIAMPFVGFQMVGGAFFQALGRARPAFVITLSRQVIVLLPLAFIVPRFYGLTGLWASFPTADLVSTTITAVWVLVAIRHLKDDPKTVEIPVDDTVDSMSPI
ncbi:MAG: MATE family efflux transporter [Candidatus Hydrogenedentota bacterium]